MVNKLQEKVHNWDNQETVDKVEECRKKMFYKTRIVYTVKPVLRGHLWDKEKVSL